MRVKITHENSLARPWFVLVSNIPVLNFRKFYTFCKVCTLTFWLIYAVLALTHILNMEQSLRGTHRCGTSACVSTAPHRKSCAQAGFRPRKGDERKSTSEHVVINSSDFRYRTESPARMGSSPVFRGQGYALPFSQHLCNPSSSHSTRFSSSGASRHCSWGHGHSREPELPPSWASLLAWTEQSVHPGVRTKVCEDVTYTQSNPNSF